jgi:hypothetical protein
VPGLERRDEGGELHADADQVPDIAQVTDRAPVTCQPRDLPNQVSSRHTAGEHPRHVARGAEPYETLRQVRSDGGTRRTIYRTGSSGHAAGALLASTHAHGVRGAEPYETAPTGSL